MNLYKWLVPAVLAVGFVLLAGCKKEEETEYDSLTGTLHLSLPEYVEPGFTKTFMIDTMMTVSRADGGTIGYRFVDPDTGEPDTLVTADGVIKKHYYTFTAANKTASQTLVFSAFTAEDAPYYGTSAYGPFTIVRPGVGGNASITKFDTRHSPIPFVDLRDLRSYYVTEIGDKMWMRQNLAWTGAGRPYHLCEAMTDVFGRYYTWEEAKNACPEGWHLPADAEWTAMMTGAEPGKDLHGLAGKVMADLYFNGTKMWEYWREVSITDDFFLSVMPVGYATIGEGEYSFDGLYSYAAFWTADEEGDYAICRYIYHSKDIVYRGKMSKTGFAASVRCVLDMD
ncbi:MAG: hypothetical protein K5849_02065 [Bacteroidales bacterium]|nr:hypothetical protein [Bacteroidales bacterium]